MSKSVRTYILLMTASVAMAVAMGFPAVSVAGPEDGDSMSSAIPSDQRTGVEGCNATAGDMELAVGLTAGGALGWATGMRYVADKGVKTDLAALYKIAGDIKTLSNDEDTARRLEILAATDDQIMKVPNSVATIGGRVESRSPEEMRSIQLTLLENNQTVPRSSPIALKGVQFSEMYGELSILPGLPVDPYLAYRALKKLENEARTQINTPIARDHMVERFRYAQAIVESERPEVIIYSQLDLKPGERFFGVPAYRQVLSRTVAQHYQLAEALKAEKISKAAYEAGERGVAQQLNALEAWGKISGTIGAYRKTPGAQFLTRLAKEPVIDLNAISRYAGAELANKGIPEAASVEVAAEISRLREISGSALMNASAAIKTEGYGWGTWASFNKALVRENTSYTRGLFKVGGAGACIIAAGSALWSLSHDETKMALPAGNLESMYSTLGVNRQVDDPHP